MSDPTPAQLTAEQRDQLVRSIASLTVTVQAVAQVFAQALAPAMAAVSAQFAELQRLLQGAGLLDAEGKPTGPSCRRPQPGHLTGPCVVIEDHIEHIDAEGHRWTWLADDLRAAREPR